jgi:hypothetical protein
LEVEGDGVNEARETIDEILGLVLRLSGWLGFGLGSVLSLSLKRLLRD